MQDKRATPPPLTAGAKEAPSGTAFASSIGLVEPLLTIPEAAKLTGLPAWTLRTAAARGLVPICGLNRRKRVRLSDVLAAIDAPQKGGE